MYALALIGCSGNAEVPEDGRNPTGYRASMAVGSVTFECLYDEATCPTDCDGNAAPVLGDPIYVVGGATVTEFELGDEVEVRVPFADADENLGCGAQIYSFASPRMSMDSSSSLCSNQPASSEDSGVYLVFDLGTILEGDYAFSLRVEDGCGASSERVEDAWTF